jgi:hypothetical protein
MEERNGGFSKRRSEMVKVLSKKQVFDECMEKYAERPPAMFRQMDAWHLPDGGDDVMHTDPEGDCLMSGITHELMHGADVRLLIRKGTSHQTAIRLLCKQLEWVRREENLILSMDDGPDDPLF